MRRIPLLLACSFALGCPSGDGDDPEPTPDPAPCDAYDDPCTFVDPNDEDADLLEVVNSLEDGHTIVLGAGVFALDNEVAINGVTGISLIGAGMDETTLDFSGMAVQGNGVSASGDDFLIQDLTVMDSPKDGIRVEDSVGVTFRRVRASWSVGPASSNGAYGLYPVRVRDVLIEESEALNASDAGIYVGQCTNAIVRNNLAARNVAGIEIENTQFADVYGNTAENNTGGLVVFDLPGNPIVGHDVYVHDNVIRNNNTPNFAPGGTVAAVPAGTGTFAMASRRVEIANNTYENNDTVDIAIISGLVIQSDEEAWANPVGDLVGDPGVLVYDQVGDTVYNYRSHDVWIHSNTHSGSGTNPDTSDIQVREFGFLLSVLFGSQPVDNVIYDGIGESGFDPDVAANNTNDNVLCVGAEEGSFINVNAGDLPALPTLSQTYRPPPPFVPFDCEALTGGPIQLPEFGE